jgi:hypothetical protein
VSRAAGVASGADVEVRPILNGCALFDGVDVRQVGLQEMEQVDAFGGKRPDHPRLR